MAITIKNNHSGAVSSVSDAQWKQIQAKGLSHLYKVVSSQGATSPSVKKNKDHSNTINNPSND
jgi:hypothetical protein